VLPPGGRVCVAFSGGLDSTVLLHLFTQLPRGHIGGLRALHVHHGLSPNADAWARACEAFCGERDIPLTVARVRVRREGEGLEAAARRARHAAFEQCADEAVALAHHRDDQAETVMLQLLRGTGLEGAAGMPEWRSLGSAHLFRPLLDVPRAALLAYARDAGLAWVEDESNADTALARNFLRHEVGPLLERRFPQWKASLARFARHAADRGSSSLRDLLRGHGLPMPSEARLREMERQLFGARPDAQVRIEHGGAVIRRYRGEIVVQRDAELEASWRVAWHGEHDVALGAARGDVRFEATRGEGLAARAVGEGEWYFAPRTGGERLRLHAHGPTRSLKNLLQEHGVPPWERAARPLLFRGAELVWAPGIGLAASYACPPGAEGLKPCWRVAGKAPLC
jgi:tRNA(Ile)-lysidine synthase